MGRRSVKKHFGAINTISVPSQPLKAKQSDAVVFGAVYSKCVSVSNRMRDMVLDEDESTSHSSLEEALLSLCGSIIVVSLF